MDPTQDSSTPEWLYKFYKSIQGMIDASIKDAPYDKTKNGLVLEVLDGGLYVVEIDKQKYTFRSVATAPILKNNIVKVVIPENQMSVAYISNVAP